MKKEKSKKVIKNKDNDKKDIMEFIKTHVLKKTKILSIVGIIMFLVIVAVFATSTISLNSGLETIQKTSLFNVLKQRMLMILLIVFSGWVPYCYIPVLAFAAYIFILSGDVALAMEIKGNIAMLLSNILPVCIDILTISIIAAIGIYMSSYSTKKYRFMQKTSFSFLDVRIQFYEMFKKQEKYDKAVAKKQERIDKVKGNNLKIDYRKIIKIVPTVAGINLIACIIEHLINN